MKSGCASCESAMVWALGQIIAQGRLDADWEAQSEANTLCKIIWDALAVCIFCEKEYVVNGWCDKKGNFSSADIYISHTKSLKNLLRFFPNLKLLDTFDCVGHLALWAFIKNSLSLSCFRVWY